MGKTLAEARGEVTYGAEFFRVVRRGGGAHLRSLLEAHPEGDCEFVSRGSPVGPLT